jgi:fluoride exporter
LWWLKMMRTVPAISLGAIAGTLSRYYLRLGITHVFSSGLPCGTLIVNVTGCFIVGFLTVLSPSAVLRIQPDMRF